MRWTLFLLLFLAGVSTRASVTSVSGRGVGLSAVLAATQLLDGRIDVVSEEGLGTTIRLTVPHEPQRARSGGSSFAARRSFAAPAPPSHS